MNRRAQRSLQSGHAQGSGIQPADERSFHRPGPLRTHTPFHAARLSPSHLSSCGTRRVALPLGAPRIASQASVLRRPRPSRPQRPFRTLRAVPSPLPNEATASKASKTKQGTHIGNIGRKLTPFLAWAHDERAPASEEEQVEDGSQHWGRRPTNERCVISNMCESIILHPAHSRPL